MKVEKSSACDGLLDGGSPSLELASGNRADRIAGSRATWWQQRKAGEGEK